MADSATITANIVDGAAISTNVVEGTSIAANVSTGAKGDPGVTGPAGTTDHLLLTNKGTNTHAQIDTALTRLVNTSGTNTGDQDLSGYATTSSVTTGLATKAASSHTHPISDVTSLQTAIDAKQATLVSGTNIKTVNGTTLLGSGDITITGGVGASPLTTKGDVYTYSTVDARLPVGINNQVLVADSTAATGLAYKYLGTSSMYNYVPNPSFEVDYTGWSNYGGAGTITRDTGFAQFGTYSSKQVSATSTDGGILSNAFVLGPGTYTFSAYAKLSSDVVNACMILRGPEGVKVQINQTYPGNPDWNRYTATFTLAGSGSYEILLGLGSYGAGSPGTVYYDAVQVELGASATSYYDGSTAPSGGTTYSWTGAAGTTQSIKAVGAALTTTDYLPEGTVNQYYNSARAVSAMSGATISPTNVFANFLGGNTLRVYDPNTPASATASGDQGQIRWDSGYLYICVSPNTWKRVAIAAW